MSDRRWCPDKCPITGRPFFCWIEDEDGTQVPTYGGPFDSYTIPEQDEDGEFTVKHYDHDLGGWRDYMNLGVRLIEDQREDHEWGTVEALQARIAELDAAIALMRGQSWQPIETAPRDGTRILGWSEEFGARETYMRKFGEGSIGYANWKAGKGPAESGWEWHEPQSGWVGGWSPTHWSELHTPPKDTADE